MTKLYSLLATMLLSALSLTANAATATVYIDKPNAVSLWNYVGDWDRIFLTNSGDTPNIIEFYCCPIKLNIVKNVWLGC